KYHLVIWHLPRTRLGARPGRTAPISRVLAHRCTPHLERRISDSGGSSPILNPTYQRAFRFVAAIFSERRKKGFVPCGLERECQFYGLKRKRKRWAVFCLQSEMLGNGETIIYKPACKPGFVPSLAGKRRSFI